MSGSISAEDISMAAGVILSLGFSYLPGLKEKFARLPATHKRLVMLAVLAGVTGGIFALSCLKVPLQGGCDQNSAWELLRALILAMIANQAAYSLSPRAAEAGAKPVLYTNDFRYKPEREDGLDRQE